MQAQATAQVGPRPRIYRTYDGLGVDAREYTRYGRVEIGFLIDGRYFIVFNTGTAERPIIECRNDLGDDGEFLYNVSRCEKRRLERDLRPYDVRDILAWVALPNNEVVPVEPAAARGNASPVRQISQATQNSGIGSRPSDSPSTSRPLCSLRDGFFLIETEDCKRRWVRTAWVAARYNRGYVIFRQRKIEASYRDNRLFVDECLREESHPEYNTPMSELDIRQWPWLLARMNELQLPISTTAWNSFSELTRSMTSVMEVGQPRNSTALHLVSSESSSGVQHPPTSRSTELLRHLLSNVSDFELHRSLLPSELSALYGSVYLSMDRAWDRNTFLNPMRELQDYAECWAALPSNSQFLLIGTDVEKLIQKILTPRRYFEHLRDNGLEEHLQFILAIAPENFGEEESRLRRGISRSWVLETPRARSPLGWTYRQVVTEPQHTGRNELCIRLNEQPTRIGRFCDLNRITREDPIDNTLLTTSYLNLTKDPLKIRVARTSRHATSRYRLNENQFQLRLTAPPNGATTSAYWLKICVDVTNERSDTRIRTSFDEPVSYLQEATVPVAPPRSLEEAAARFEFAQNNFLRSRILYLNATTYLEETTQNLYRAQIAIRDCAENLLRFFRAFPQKLKISRQRLYFTLDDKIYTVENSTRQELLPQLQDLEELGTPTLFHNGTKDVLNGSIRVKKMLEDETYLTFRRFPLQMNGSRHVWSTEPITDLEVMAIIEEVGKYTDRAEYSRMI